MNKISFLVNIILVIIVVMLLLSPKGSLNPKTTAQKGLEELSSKYSYLATRVLVDFEKDLLVNFMSLRKQLKTETDEYKGSFSVYFEYLPTGISIGINDRTEFYGASLAKVPVAMAFLKYARRVNLDLDQKVRIEKGDINRTFGDLWQKGEGAEITFTEALGLALIKSDNTAAEILVRRVPREDLLYIYENLDVDYNINEGQVIITTKGYSSILKALYFSSVLDKDDSQYLLDLLTRSDFKDKLRFPIPKEIVIANKAGVFYKDLHQDCGIVYVPRRPYILCMASLSSEAEATKRMIIVSEMVYKYVSSF